MKSYTNEERFEVLNRHIGTLCIENEVAFTTLTQHFNYKSIEEIADTILHYENFNRIYGETKFFERNTYLYKNRKAIFFNEDRILSDVETEHYIKKDEEYQAAMQKCHDGAQL